MIRECLIAMLQREPGIDVCAQADNSEEAVRLAVRHRPDLVILDLTLNRSHGLDCLEALRTRCPQAAVLVVSVHEESLQAERALRAGARGYIEKREPTEKILQAVRTVLAGRVYASEQVAERLAQGVAGRGRSPAAFWVDSLAEREARVLELLGRGRTTRQIAEELEVKVSTVETYRARIKAKLGLRDSFELMQHAIRWVEGRELAGSGRPV